MSTFPSDRQEVYPETDFTNSIKDPDQEVSVFEIEMRSRRRRRKRDGSATKRWTYKPALLETRSSEAARERHGAAIAEFCHVLDASRLSKDLTVTEHNNALLTIAKDFRYTHNFFKPRCRVWSRGISDSTETRHFDVVVGEVSRRQTFLDFISGRPHPNPGTYHEVVYDNERATRSQDHRRRGRVAVQESAGVQEEEEGEI